jgi:tRNA A-37 threonylcarbamoyl transferase component Bud32
MRLPKDKQVIVERHNKIVYDCGDTVVKVFNGNKPAADIFAEATKLARAEQAGINVPELVEVSKAGVNWAISTKKVEGQTLREQLKANPEREDEILDQLISLELDVHAHKSPLMGRQKDKLTRMINAASDIIGEAQRYELLHSLEGMPNHSKLCHGDFVPSNIVIPDDGSAPVILDWAHATQGNGAADAARTYLTFVLKDKKELGEKYLKLFCEKTDTARQYVDRWMPIVAASQSVKGKPEERELLLSWASVCEYE